MSEFSGVKVFSATKSRDRELLGELITDWLRTNPDKEIVDKTITQSSDSAFHCLTITLFYKWTTVVDDAPSENWDKTCGHKWGAYVCVAPAGVVHDEHYTVGRMAVWRDTPIDADARSPRTRLVFLEDVRPTGKKP